MMEKILEKIREISGTYVKDKKYDIGVITYYWDSECEYHEIYS